MNIQRRRLTQFVLALGALAVTPAGFTQPSVADNYPSKPLRLVIPFAPGGGTDIVGRLVAKKLGDAWGKAVVVENKPGGNGTLGAESVSKAAPDGYTLTMITASHSVNVTLQGKKHGYDLERDLTPIAQITTQPYVLVVNPKLPVKTLADLIALAKAKPGTLNFGSSGIGGLSHLSGELFNSMAGINIAHIPYKGGTPAMNDVMGGQIDMLFSTQTQAAPFIASGRLRALAVTSLKRAAAAPTIPTMDEAGVPGYEVAGWYGMLAPAGTPPAIVAKLNQEIVRIMAQPDVSERLKIDGSQPVGSAPREFATHIHNQIERWRQVIKQTGIPVG